MSVAPLHSPAESGKDNFQFSTFNFQFLLDLHVHSWFSGDASASPEMLVSHARERGLHGIAITDHGTCGAYEHCLAHGLATRDGRPVDGFLIVPGVEIYAREGHVLCIGALLEDRWNDKPLAEIVRETTKRGSVAIPAHPFDRWRAGVGEKGLDSVPELAAIETFNPASSRGANAKARRYARERGLAAIAGSDAHHASAVGVCWTEFDLDELSVSAIVAAITRGAGTPHEAYLSKREALKKHFANWFRKPRGRRKKK